MGKITFILGGVRSGKSTHALRLAKKHRNVAFIATCHRRKDKEMEKRIRLHQKARPLHWKTYEETKDLASLFMEIGDLFDCIIIDCLTLLVSNLTLDGNSEAKIVKKIEALLATLRKKKAKVIMVSNEVGLGIVPNNKLARDFRDIAGKVNQIVAGHATEVFFMAAGLPLKIK